MQVVRGLRPEVIKEVEEKGSVGWKKQWEDRNCPVAELPVKRAGCPLWHENQSCEGTGKFCHAHCADRYHHCEFYQGYIYRGIVEMSGRSRLKRDMP